MSIPRRAPWELYSKTMFNHFGFPLWHADPEMDAQFGPREVELGSFGYLDRGRFRTIFNAGRTHDDPFNTGRVPPTFEVFNPTNMKVTAQEPMLRQPYVASGSVGDVVVSPEGNESSLVSAGGSLSFECKQDVGAVLLLDEPAIGQSIPTKRHIMAYLRRHIESIYEYATGSPEGLGYDLQTHDIKFVSGTLKTTKWACAAFSGGYRNKKGLLTLSVPGVEDLDMSMQVSIGEQVVPDEFCNHGPSSTDGASRASAPSSPVLATAVSAREYETKQHLDLTSGETVPDRRFDPVAILLDYMLANTDAECAVASTLDVLAIFGPAGVPDDIMAGLETIRPAIEVDEDGGMPHFSCIQAL
ncbi:hypothetical protein V8D89_009310 [Ganoderma adspersum]